MVSLPALPAIDPLRGRLNQAIGLREGVRKNLEKNGLEIQTLEEEEELTELVGALFHTMIDAEIVDGVKGTEKLMTEGLQSVFDDQDLSVTGSVEVQRGKVSVDLRTRNNLEDGNIIEGSVNDSFGGAVTTVESVLMRIIVVMRREMRYLLLLDESLPAFDVNYVHNMAKFLKLLCERLGMDILLVTHNPTLVEAGSRAYLIKKKAVARFVEAK